MFHRLILRGYKSTLSYNDMWDIREEDTSETVVNKFEPEWEKELQNHRLVYQPLMVGMTHYVY